MPQNPTTSSRYGKYYLIKTKNKNQEDQDAQEFQKQQVTQVLNFGSTLRWLMRLLIFGKNVLTLAKTSIGPIIQVIQPLNALVTGMFTIVELVEALFLSQETRNRRAVKAMTSFIASSLSIAAAVLSFNPVTAPLGSCLAAAAILVAATKDAFFWYKASKDINKIMVQLKDKSITPQQHAKLTSKLAELQKTRNERQRSFAYNLLSAVGVILFAVASFALLGAIAANPIGLGIAAAIVLGAAVVGGAYNTYKKYYPDVDTKKVVSAQVNATQVVEAPSNDKDFEHHQHEPESTANIAHRLDHDHPTEFVQGVIANVTESESVAQITRHASFVSQSGTDIDTDTDTDKDTDLDTKSEHPHL